MQSPLGHRSASQGSPEGWALPVCPAQRRLIWQQGVLPESLFHLPQSPPFPVPTEHLPPSRAVEHLDSQVVCCGIRGISPDP